MHSASLGTLLSIALLASGCPADAGQTSDPAIEKDRDASAADGAQNGSGGDGAPGTAADPHGDQDGDTIQNADESNVDTDRDGKSDDLDADRRTAISTGDPRRGRLLHDGLERVDGG